jgi:hypothetical protein
MTLRSSKLSLRFGETYRMFLRNVGSHAHIPVDNAPHSYRRENIPEGKALRSCLL